MNNINILRQYKKVTQNNNVFAVFTHGMDTLYVKYNKNNTSLTIVCFGIVSATSEQFFSEKNCPHKLEFVKLSYKTVSATSEQFFSEKNFPHKLKFVKLSYKTDRSYADKLIILDTETGEILYWSIDKILHELNRDRNQHWINYNERDFQEGLECFTQYRFLGAA